MNIELFQLNNSYNIKYNLYEMNTNHIKRSKTRKLLFELAMKNT